ncbi:putative ATP-dependent RNA helicase DDX47 [Armadillidium vulgare]|nr:putative ATP-dependent RNA helicase DDX47 [Armadillidium vulgare]
MRKWINRSWKNEDKNKFENEKSFEEFEVEENYFEKLHVVLYIFSWTSVYLLSVIKRIVLSLKSIIVLKCMISRIISIVTHELPLRLL